MASKKKTASTAVKKTAAKKTSTVAETAAKAGAQPAAAKKTAAKKTAAKKTAVKKAAAKKTAAGKAAAKKVTAKKAAVKKTAAKKAAAKKTAAKKVAARKTAAKKTVRRSRKKTRAAETRPAPEPFRGKKASYSAPHPVPQTPAPVRVKVDSRLSRNWETKAGEDLSEEEVLAMPESEYMNDKQLAFFRKKLTDLSSSLLDKANETTENLREDTALMPDPTDRATIEEEHALELRTRDRERKLLKKVQQAIASIDSGDYGYCDETGEPIGVGRLLARPTANLCLEAQQRRELKQKMFGD